MNTQSLTSWCAAILLILATSNLPAAGETLDDAKALYAAASFEDALATLDRIDGAKTQPEALEYRALCLMALGRLADAQAVAETLVAVAPTFIPPQTDLPPRFMTLFNETRRKALPALARRIFADARDQFHAKKQADAERGFRQVMTLATDPLWKDASEAGDLRTLASGFLDLMTAEEAPATAPGEPDPSAPRLAAAPATQAQAAATSSTLPASAAPSPSTAPPRPLAPAASAGASRTVAPRPAEPAAVATSGTSAPLPQTAATGNREAVQPPVVIRQVMPRWEAPDLVSAQRTFSGSLRIRIGTRGEVISATIQTPTHPLYDQQLLEASRSWLYKPAMLNGEPVEVEKTVAYSLKAR